MILRLGLTMGSLDTYLHIIVAEMIVILAIVLPYMESKAPKRIVSKLFLLLLGFMLVHFTMHLLPKKIASFIYSSHPEFNAKKT